MKLNHQYNTGLSLIIIIVISTAFTEGIQVRQEMQNPYSTSALHILWAIDYILIFLTIFQRF